MRKAQLRSEEFPMAEHQVIVERSDSGSGMARGLMIGALVLVAAMVAVLMMNGGPSRFMGPAPAGQTNINVPAQPAAQQPAAQQPAGPAIQIPRQIDVNVNQGAPQVPQQVPDGSTR
jgi:hypothetical protein